MGSLPAEKTRDKMIETKIQDSLAIIKTSSSFRTSTTAAKVNVKGCTELYPISGEK